jgi:uncharacterized protein involved in exopolysaccharide biosynthesis
VNRYIETLFRNRWRVLVPALCLLGSGLGLALLLPLRYEATATIWTEAATYLDVPTAQNQYLSPAEAERRRFGELVRTHAFATAVVDRLPHAQTATDRERQAFTKRVQNDVQVLSTGDNTMEVRFRYTDAAIALAVVDQSIAEYTRVTNETAALQASEAIRFYREQVRMYEDEILPRSALAVAAYVEETPQARQVGPDGVPIDPQYALLEQQARADRAMYQDYQQRLNRVETQSQAVSTSQPVAFRVIDPPRVPANSGASNVKLWALFASLGAGLSVGYVLVFVGLATTLDSSLRSAADVQRVLHLPTLVVVPDYTTKRSARHATQRSGARASTVRRSLFGKANV